MRLSNKILFVTAAVFIVIQFIQPARNRNRQILPTDITKVLKVPHSVLKVFQNSCYDCHSNNTQYPWYVNIQPVGWMLANHIKQGKESLNFSDFGSYSNRKQMNKLRAIQTSMKEGSMPLSSYTLIHSNATLGEGDKEVITEWISTTKDSLARKN